MTEKCGTKCRGNKYLVERFVIFACGKIAMRKNRLPQEWPCAIYRAKFVGAKIAMRKNRLALISPCANISLRENRLAQKSPSQEWPCALQRRENFK